MSKDINIMKEYKKDSRLDTTTSKNRFEIASELFENLSNLFTKCHHGCLMVSSCISSNHDPYHIKFLSTDQGKKEEKLFRSLEILNDMAWRKDFVPDDSLLIGLNND